MNWNSNNVIKKIRLNFTEKPIGAGGNLLVWKQLEALLASMQEDAYDRGYKEGHDKGHNEGYKEGYSKAVKDHSKK